MLRMKRFLILLPLALSLQFCTYSQTNKTISMDSTNKNNPVYSNTDSSKVSLTEAEWKKILPADVYQIARQKGTERPGSSPLEHIKDRGTFYCAACGNALFVSDAKFESGCGWPSFVPCSGGVPQGDCARSAGMTCARRRGDVRNAGRGW